MSTGKPRRTSPVEIVIVIIVFFSCMIYLILISADLPACLQVPPGGQAESPHPCPH